MPKPKSSQEGASLLANDQVAKEYEGQDLSGSVDILWQLKDGASKDVVIEISEESKEFMSEFFERVKGVKDDMSAIRRNINSIKELHSKIITEVSQQKTKEHTERLDGLLADTSKTAKKVKDSLRDIDAENDEYRLRYGKDSSETRIHMNMHGSITKKFVELMRDYEGVQSNYKQLLRDRVARQVKVVNPNATPEEVEQAVENGGQDVFADRLLSRADQAAMNAFAEVQSKHEELMRLETSIRELNQLFTDMAIMVEQQGEQLDNIEEQVSKAAEFTGQGVVQLEKAKDYQKSARKKMCCLAVCFAILLMIFLSFITSWIPGV